MKFSTPFYFVTVLLFLTSSGTVFGQTYDVSRYGAVGDGKTINTKAIQRAIDDCNSQGGGTVFFSQGTYISGAIRIKSHVNLSLSSAAVLKGSSNLEDYRVEGTTYGLLTALDAEDISLTGPGEINGNCAYFMYPDKRHTFVDYNPDFTRQGNAFMHNYEGIGDGPIAHADRPDMMITLKHCSNVRLSGLKLTNAPNWTIRLGECENVVITGLMILNNPLVPNNDGIHCATSRNVVIGDCVISGGDDAVVVSGFGDESGVSGYTEKLKSTIFQFGNKTKKAQNIAVSNCVLSSASAAIRIGYGPNAISDCTFNNIIIHDSNRGILIQCRDDMNITHLKFSHINIDTRLFSGCWWGKGEPIHLSTMPQQGTLRTGSIIDVNFSDIAITHAEAGIVIYGADKKSPIKDISFDNVSINLFRGANSETFGGNFDLRPTNNYATNLFKHDIPALYAKNVLNLRLGNVSVNWGNNLPGYFTAGICCEGFQGLFIDGFTGRQAGESGPAISLTKGSNVTVKNCVAASGTGSFLDLHDVSDLNYLTGNDLNALSEPVPAALFKRFKISSGNISTKRVHK